MRDGALQLLLIVDYVVDWARDIYRENIINNLRSLASGDNDAASTFYPDTDIFSTREFETLDTSSPPPHEDQARVEYSPGQRSFMACDSKLHAVRHGSLVESRFRCVVVTPDNVQTMLHLTKRHMTHQLCRSVLSEMSTCFLLKYEAITAIESYWTGTSRTTPKVLKDDDKFFAAVGCCYFISPTWHLVRELHVFAIAEDAWDAFAAFSALKPKRTIRPDQTEITEAQELLVLIDWCTPMESPLLFCLNRLCMVFTYQKRFAFRLANGMLRAIVNYTHSEFRKESADARATFLRSSRRLEEKDNGPRAQHCTYTTHFDEPFDLSDGETILVYARSSNRDRDRSSANICLYIINQSETPPNGHEITRRIKQTYATRDVYRSTRDNGPESINSKTLAEWNIRKNGQSKPVYGLCLEPKVFIDLLQMLDPSDLPARQGSPRVSDGAKSGSYLYKRCLNPWKAREPRYTMRNTTLSGTTQMFLVYKVISTEIQYWKQVAVERQSHGLLSCSCCASVEDVVLDAVGLCEECTRASRDADLPPWLRKIILGKPPFQVRGNNKRKENVCYFPLSNSEDWDEVMWDYPALGLAFDDVSMLQLQCNSFDEWYISALRRKRQS